MNSVYYKFLLRCLDNFLIEIPIFLLHLKKRPFSLLLYAFFDVESESRIHF